MLSLEIRKPPNIEMVEARLQGVPGTSASSPRFPYAALPGPSMTMPTTIDPFEIRDVTHWLPAAPESRGKREKLWVVDPEGNRWLRKLALVSPPRPFEPMVEATTLRLARAAGLQAPESHPCEWVEQDERRQGIVIRSFTHTIGELSEGAEVLKGADPAYDPGNKAAHTIGRVKEALKRQERRSKGAFREAFMEMLLFDAWVGNGDRHPANWGIIRTRTGAESLAPIYDTAACLGVELSGSDSLLNSAQRTDVRLARYITGCPSGFGNGKVLIGQEDVLASVRRWSGWAGVTKGLLERFDRLWDGPLWSYLGTIPTDWLPDERRLLMKELLGMRLAWLRGRV